MPKSSSGLLPWLAANRLRGKPVGPFDFWPKRPSNASWCREWDEKRSGLCCKATTQSRGGKKMWCVAELDEEYIARMEDVLSVYERPLSAREPVVCIDEKPVVLHEEVRPPLAMQPGRVARRDAEYRRCGTANVFCGVQPKAGRHFTKVTNDRSSSEFADYLLDVAARYPEADTIHLVMDNLSSHTRKAVVQRFGEEAGDWLWNRFTVHYTPKHGSWLNQAEIAISLFSRQCLGQRRIGDRASQRKETRAWNRRVNRDRVTIQWSFTRKQARKKFGYKITRSRY